MEQHGDAKLPSSCIRSPIAEGARPLHLRSLQGRVRQSQPVEHVIDAIGRDRVPSQGLLPSGDSDASKFSVTGCDMEISGSVISSFALLPNEFATNATKYGALSTAAGRIRIQCANQGETLFVTWAERGGPEIVAPTNKRFGDLLVCTTIAGLGGEISREGHLEGLNIRLAIPRERLTP
jgi:two-component sensor histidine kinase